MYKDKSIIKTRKKTWDIMHYGYNNQPNRLFKNKSLTCNCSQCRWIRFMKIKKRRDFRHKSKISLKYEE